MSRMMVITGAFGVLGSAVAEAAGRQGYKLALLDYAPAPGVQADLVLGGVDLTDPAAAHQAIDEVATKLGRLDVLLNIAGGFSWETVGEGDAETWARLFRMNVQTAANACRAALPHLKASPSGRIVNVGANGAIKADLGMGAYAASKAGVHRLTESLAEELKASGVTVNAVLPSIIDTPTNRADMPNADPGDWVAPADLAAAILFLASEEARAITGALVPVTGRL